MSSGRAEKACEKFRPWAGGANPGLCGNCAWPEDLHGVKPVIVLADDKTSAAVFAAARMGAHPLAITTALNQQAAEKEQAEAQTKQRPPTFKVTRQMRRQAERFAAKAAEKREKEQKSGTRRVQVGTTDVRGMRPNLTGGQQS